MLCRAHFRTLNAGVLITDGSWMKPSLGTALSWRTEALEKAPPDDSPLLRASHFQWPSMCSIDYCQCRPFLLFGGVVRIPSQKTTQTWFKSIEKSLLASWQLHWVFRILPQAQKPYPGLTYFSSISQRQNHRSQKARDFPRAMGSNGLGTFVSAGGTVCMLSFMVVAGTVSVSPLQLVTAQPFFSKKPPACQDLSPIFLPWNPGCTKPQLLWDICYH